MQVVRLTSRDCSPFMEDDTCCKHSSETGCEKEELEGRNLKEELELDLPKRGTWSPNIFIDWFIYFGGKLSLDFALIYWKLRYELMNCDKFSPYLPVEESHFFNVSETQLPHTKWLHLNSNTNWVELNATHESPSWHKSFNCEGSRSEEDREHVFTRVSLIFYADRIAYESMLLWKEHQAEFLLGLPPDVALC